MTMPHGLVLGRFSVKCRCGKIVGLSLEDAKLQYRKFSKVHGRTNPVRYYQCPNQSWHWTQQLAVPERYATDQPPTPKPGKTPKPGPCKNQKPTCPKPVAVHHERRIDWETLERIPPGTTKPLIRKSVLRGGKLFWLNTDGAAGYADTWCAAWLALRQPTTQEKDQTE